MLFFLDQNNIPIQQLPPNEFTIKVTLEEIFHGCTRTEQITRKVIDENGIEQTELATLSVEIFPGIVNKARITNHTKAGDKIFGKIPANVVFIVDEETHPIYKRVRFDLHYTAKLKGTEACSEEIFISTIDGSTVKLAMNEVITPNTIKIILNHGLPIPNCNGKRGNLVVKFEIIYGKVNLVNFRK